MATSLTYTVKAKESQGNYRSHVVDILADATYSTSGYTLAAADFSALTRPGVVIGDLLSFQSETNAGGVTATLDRANSKLLFWEAGAQATTTISSKTVRARVSYAYVNHK